MSNELSTSSVNSFNSTCSSNKSIKNSNSLNVPSNNNTQDLESNTNTTATTSSLNIIPKSSPTKLTTTFILPTLPTIPISTSTTTTNNNNSNNPTPIKLSSGSILSRFGRKLSQSKVQLVRRVSSTNRSSSKKIASSNHSSSYKEVIELIPPIPLISKSLTRSLTKSKGKEREVLNNHRSSADQEVTSKVVKREQENEEEEEEEEEDDRTPTRTEGDRTPMSRITLNRRLGRSKSEGRRRNGQELEVIMGWGDGSQKSGSRKLYWEERLGICWDGREQVHPDLDFVYSSNSDVLPPSARVVYASTLSTFLPRPPLRSRLSLPPTSTTTTSTSIIPLSPAAQVKEDYLRSCREEERIALGLPAELEERVVEEEEDELRTISTTSENITPIPTPRPLASKVQYASSAILDDIDDDDSLLDNNNDLDSNNNSIIDYQDSFTTNSTSNHHQLSSNATSEEGGNHTSSISTHPQTPSSSSEINSSSNNKQVKEVSYTSLESLRVLEVRHKKMSELIRKNSSTIPTNTVSSNINSTSNTNRYTLTDEGPTTKWRESE